MNDSEDEKLSSLEEKLSYKFVNRSFLINALTHSSIVNERKGALSNERMEFLGDSILSFFVSQFLYENYQKNEGELSKMRSSLVNENSLYEIALLYNIDKCIRVGGSIKNELARIGHIPKSILADCVEAIIAAIFLDGGDIRSVIDRMIDYLINKINVFDSINIKDYKSLLQELIQKKLHVTPIYKSVKLGFSPQEEFEVSILLNDRLVYKTKSSSIKNGQKECARKVYEMIGSGKLKI